MSLTKDINQIEDVMNYVRLRKYTRKDISNYAPANEKPRNILQVKLPKEGGILTYFEGFPYPAKGFPVAEGVAKIDDVKKNVFSILSGFKKMFFRNRIKTLIFLFVFRKELIQSLDALVDSLWKQTRLYFLREERYCQCVRELHRAFAFVVPTFAEERVPNDTPIIKRANRTLPPLPVKIQRVITIRRIEGLVRLVLEYDDAYRYRFQDIIGEFNREAFRKNSMKELSRLIEIGALRERSTRVKEVWRIVKLFIRLARFHPIRKKIILFFEHLNIEEVRLSEGDLYFAREKPDYQWSGNE